MSINPAEFPWLAVVHKRAREASTGAFIAQDLHKHNVLIEWTFAPMISPECRALKTMLVDLGCEQTIPVECAFLKAHPQAVQTDGFLHACAPLFANGAQSVDWDACYKTLEATLRTIYTADINEFGEEIVQKLQHDMILFVTAKDVVNDELLGFVLCGVTPASALGDVKIISCIVAKNHHNKGIERLLLSGVLKALPSALRLFAGIRPTNTALSKVYQSCGFEPIEELTQDPNHNFDEDSWTLLAYDVMLKGRL